MFKSDKPITPDMLLGSKAPDSIQEMLQIACTSTSRKKATEYICMCLGIEDTTDHYWTDSRNWEQNIYDRAKTDYMRFCVLRSWMRALLNTCVHYKHPEETDKPMSEEDIRYNVVNNALRYTDLDDCCRSIQNHLGITDGGMASLCFHGISKEEWAKMDDGTRFSRLSGYYDYEATLRKREPETIKEPDFMPLAPIDGLVERYE